jgi:putative peptidoglycan lipid II flippase
LAVNPARDARPVESTAVDGTTPTGSTARPRTWWQQGVAVLRPSHAHTVFSATLVLMTSTFLSRIIGLVRAKYIALLLGS